MPFITVHSLLTSFFILCDKSFLFSHNFSDNLPYEKIGKSEPVCIADEVPFDIPESWEWTRLGAISTYADTKKKINAQSADPNTWGLDLEDIEKGGRLLYHDLNHGATRQFD